MKTDQLQIATIVWGGGGGDCSLGHFGGGDSSLDPKTTIIPKSEKYNNCKSIFQENKKMLSCNYKFCYIILFPTPPPPTRTI